jgi:hypothetical protein
VSTTSDPAARTPGRHAGPEAQLQALEGQWLSLKAAALIDRHAALTSASSGAGPLDYDEAVTALLQWSREALDVLREVAR